jgi:hypothetical protein
MLKRLAGLVNEPRVLHRDDHLRGEVLQHCQFSVGERSNFEAASDDLPEQDVISAQRHIDDGSDATEFGAQSRNRIVDLGHVCAVRHPRPINQDAARVVGSRAIVLSQCLHHGLREAAHRDATKLLAIPELKAATRSACGSANAPPGVGPLADLFGPYSQRNHTVNRWANHIVIDQDDQCCANDR